MCCAHVTRLRRVCLCYHVPYEEQSSMQVEDKVLEIEVRMETECKCMIQNITTTLINKVRT